MRAIGGCITGFLVLPVQALAEKYTYMPAGPGAPMIKGSAS